MPRGVYDRSKAKPRKTKAPREAEDMAKGELASHGKRYATTADMIEAGIPIKDSSITPEEIDRVQAEQEAAEQVVVYAPIAITRETAAGVWAAVDAFEASTAALDVPINEGAVITLPQDDGSIIEVNWDGAYWSLSSYVAVE